MSDIVTRIDNSDWTDENIWNLALEAMDEITRLRRLLKEHHDWHMSQGDVSAPDDDGGHITWDATEAYQESGFCDRTVLALSVCKTGESK